MKTSELLPRGEHQLQGSVMQTLSAVISTMSTFSRKGGSIRHTILSLCNQTRKPDEIVIADNSDTAEDREFLREFVARSQLASIVTIVETSENVGKARNIAAAEAMGDVILFIDDDTILLSHLDVEGAEAALSDGGSACGATRLWTTPLGWFEKSSDEILAGIRHGDFSCLQDHLSDPPPELRGKSAEAAFILSRTFIGNLGLVRRSTFLAVGGFPEDFDGYGMEDDALMMKLASASASPKSLRSIEVAHVSHRSSELERGGDQSNSAKFLLLRRQLGLAEFHVSRILYPESRPGPVVVKI
jgi:GT2 family glycosyltransferase